ncbi:hypothetical protein D3C87_1500790 [compost metagenome]
MILIAFVLVSSSLSAQAAGREEASQICTSMSFDSGKSACIASIRNYEYFERGAIDICSGMSFDSGKLQCVTAIGNKTYENYEIQACEVQSFDSGKVSCLQNGGRAFRRSPPPPQRACFSKSRLIQKLQIVDDLVYNGQNRSARIELNDLMNQIANCP